MTEVKQPRLPAVERRAAIVAAALEVFGSGSYSGSTTAGIARAACVSEPIIYRHFPSKRELWFACLDEAWRELRAAIEQKVVAMNDPSGLPDVDIAEQSPWANPLLPNLWLQGVTEAAEDEEIQARVRAHVREVHDFVADLMVEHQAAGAIPADRNPDAEAWLFLAGGLLRSFADRLGGLLGSAEFAAIGRERRRWLSGG
ncbi:TetR/AcrR family transcriptional regulator [Gaiella sp.]|uniref:TetR/AcrR family transcriptional regulator n=1 Tax=Gaiella sp. TaxID=2663207 RepID=UPI0039830C00